MKLGYYWAKRGDKWRIVEVVKGQPNFIMEDGCAAKPWSYSELDGPLVRREERSQADPEQWIVGKPGGPSGPFWSIVSSSGRVIAMQIPDESIANELVRLHEAVLS